MNTPFGSFGLSAAQASKGFARLRSIGLAQLLHTPFFNVEPREHGFLITFCNRARSAEIRQWLASRGYEAQTANGIGWHVFDVDRDTALLAKLTWGGAQ